MRFCNPVSFIHSFNIPILIINLVNIGVHRPYQIVTYQISARKIINLLTGFERFWYILFDRNASVAQLTHKEPVQISFQVSSHQKFFHVNLNISCG